MAMEVLSFELGVPLMIVNIYGPCQGKASFWNSLLSKSLMRNPNLVVGGDLNFSIRTTETWGPTAREDSLSNFLLNLLNTHNLMDINLLKLRPIWRNRRTREARIAKRLDQLLLCEEVTSRIPAFHQWVGEGGNSDHLPILLEPSKPPEKLATPFKFKSSWLQEDSFNKLFRETWRSPSINATEEKGFLFMQNLKRLKRETMEWSKARKQK